MSLHEVSYIYLQLLKSWMEIEPVTFSTIAYQCKVECCRSHGYRNNTMSCKKIISMCLPSLVQNLQLYTKMNSKYKVIGINSTVENLKYFEPRLGFEPITFGSIT